MWLFWSENSVSRKPSGGYLSKGGFHRFLDEYVRNTLAYVQVFSALKDNKKLKSHEISNLQFWKYARNNFGLF